jgi:hypothetical protein
MKRLLRVVRNISIYLIILELSIWSGWQIMQNILTNFISGGTLIVVDSNRLYYLILFLLSWPGIAAFVATTTKYQNTNFSYQAAGVSLAIYALILATFVILILNRLLRKVPIQPKTNP